MLIETHPYESDQMLLHESVNLTEDSSMST